MTTPPAPQLVVVQIVPLAEGQTKATVPSAPVGGLIVMVPLVAFVTASVPTELPAAPKVIPAVPISVVKVPAAAAVPPIAGGEAR